MLPWLGRTSRLRSSGIKRHLTSYRQAKSEAEEASATARAAQNRAAEARKTAESAGAPGRATLLWAKAETAQREAEAALDQHAFDRAQTLFGDAERGYREAEHQAGDYGRADADAARKLAASARKEGERADARRLAPASFASAQQKEDEAVVLTRPPGLAVRHGGIQGSGAHVQASGAGRRGQPSGAPAGGSIAGSRACDRSLARRRASCRRAARCGSVCLGGRKQREAQAAFGRSEYDEAARLSRETQADYETAAQEAEARRWRRAGPAERRASAEEDSSLPGTGDQAGCGTTGPRSLHHGPREGSRSRRADEAAELSPGHPELWGSWRSLPGRCAPGRGAPRGQYGSNTDAGRKATSEPKRAGVQGSPHGGGVRYFGVRAPRLQGSHGTIHDSPGVLRKGGGEDGGGLTVFAGPAADSQPGALVPRKN